MREIRWIISEGFTEVSGLLWSSVCKFCLSGTVVHPCCAHSRVSLPLLETFTTCLRPFVWIHVVLCGQVRPRLCWRTDPLCNWWTHCTCTPGKTVAEWTYPVHYATNSHHNQHSLNGHSPSSGQEMWFLAIRQSDFLLCSVSFSSVWYWRADLLISAECSTQCSAPVSSGIQTQKSLWVNPTMQYEYFYHIYRRVQMFLKIKKK